MFFENLKDRIPNLNKRNTKSESVVVELFQFTLSRCLMNPLVGRRYSEMMGDFLGRVHQQARYFSLIIVIRWYHPVQHGAASAAEFVLTCSGFAVMFRIYFAFSLIIHEYLAVIFGYILLLLQLVCTRIPHEGC